jgi:hypothetical protein
MQSFLVTPNLIVLAVSVEGSNAEDLAGRVTSRIVMNGRFAGLWVTKSEECAPDRNGPKAGRPALDPLKLGSLS